MNRSLLFLGVLGLAVIGGGVFYFSGDKTPAAVTAAAEAPSPQALREAARAAFLGDGVAQSDAEGARLMLDAAAAGDEQAIGFAGTLYMGGIGVEHSVKKAREWLSRSSDEEAQALAQALLTFEAVLATMPEEEAELQKAMDEEGARESIRAAFIAALERDRMNAAETAAGEDALPEGEAGASEGYAGADGEDAYEEEYDETAEDADAQDSHPPQE